MKPVEGLIGPGISPNDLNLDLPDCVRLATPQDGEAFKAMLATIVRATNANAARVLRSMLATTPGADQLSNEFAQRLGA